MTKRRVAQRGRPQRVPATKAPPPRPAPEPLEPAPPLHRDRWAWLAALAVLPVVIHAWGAPLGEAVAGDFDFLQRVLFSQTPTLLDGGGSTPLSRPMAQQLYHQTLCRANPHHSRCGPNL